MSNKNIEEGISKASMLEALDILLDHVDEELVQYHLGGIPKPEGTEQVQRAFHLLVEWHNQQCSQREETDKRSKCNYNEILSSLNHVVGYYFSFAQAEMERCIEMGCYDGGNWHIYDSMRVLQELLVKANAVNERRFRRWMQEIRDERAQIEREDLQQAEKQG